MFGVLRALTRPWRVVRKVRALKDAIVVRLGQVLDLQREVRAEVRELHESSLIAAINLIEEQCRIREELARDRARLERRLEVLERRLAAAAGPTGE